MKTISRDKQFELKKIKIAKFGLHVEFNIIRECGGVEEAVKNKLDLPFCANADLSASLDTFVCKFASNVLLQVFCFDLGDLHDAGSEMKLKELSISNNGISLQLIVEGEQGEFIIKSPKLDRTQYEGVLEKIESAVYDFLSNENGEHLEELF